MQSRYGPYSYRCSLELLKVLYTPILAKNIKIVAAAIIAIISKFNESSFYLFSDYSEWSGDEFSPK
jgi:hypothetical protein